MLTPNLLETFKAAALDQGERQSRPKRLRFTVFPRSDAWCGMQGSCCCGWRRPYAIGSWVLAVGDPQAAVVTGMNRRAAYVGGHSRRGMPGAPLASPSRPVPPAIREFIG